MDMDNLGDDIIILNEKGEIISIDDVEGLAGSENLILIDKNSEEMVLLLNSRTMHTLEDELDDEMNSYKQKEETKVLKPKELVDKLNTTVIGQLQAKKVISTAIYEASMRIKYPHLDIKANNILLTGASGSGKTFLVETACRLSDVPYIIVDASKQSKTGYVGGDVKDFIKDLVNKYHGDMNLVNNAVVFIDEFCKIKAVDNNKRDEKDVSGRSVQEEYLKLIEGMEIPIGYGKTVSTKNMTFILAGSFENGIRDIVEERLRKEEGEPERVMGFGREVLGKIKPKEYTEREIRENINRDDILKFGFIPEIVGRIDVIANLLPLELSDFIKIVKNKNGAFHSKQDLFEIIGKKFIVKEEVFEEIANIAFNNSRLGARSINSLIGNILNYVIYEFTDSIENEIILDSELLHVILDDRKEVI